MSEEKTLYEMQQEAKREEQKNEAPQANTTQQPEQENNMAENTLRTIANIILTLGIIATIICAFTITYTSERLYYDHWENKANIDGIITTITILFASVVSWALMRVFADISTSLNEIKKAVTAPIITEVMAKIVTNTKEINEKIK